MYIAYILQLNFVYYITFNIPNFFNFFLYYSPTGNNEPPAPGRGFLLLTSEEEIEMYVCVYIYSKYFYL